jgi:hypothetical protein
MSIEKYLTTKEVNIIHYRNLNKFINESFGKYDYNIVEDMEALNDSYLYFEVSKELLTQIEETKLYKFTGKNIIGFTLPVILKHLCNKGRLEEGNYLIQVSW